LANHLQPHSSSSDRLRISGDLLSCRWRPVLAKWDYLTVSAGGESVFHRCWKSSSI
jgi:hypothetical protein